MFPVNQILKSPEDGTGSRHPSFGDVGSVTPPGFKRSLQRCSGLLLCVWRRKLPPGRQNGDGSTAGNLPTDKAEVPRPAGAARSKGLGRSPTSPCKARGFVHTKTLLASDKPPARAHDFQRKSSALHLIEGDCVTHHRQSAFRPMPGVSGHEPHTWPGRNGTWRFLPQSG